MEIWKPIIGEYYEVSNRGRFRSITHKSLGRWGNLKNSPGRILKGYLMSNGYIRIDLSLAGVIKHYSAHRLVATAFIPNPFFYPNVNHIDSNRQNNHVDNLEWCTHKQNMAYASKQGRTPQGSKHPNAKLTEDAVREIKRLRGTIMQTELARRYGVSKHAIWLIYHGRGWNHVK